MYQEFKGEVAFVTGATSGIGRATANAFARDGARVAVIGRNADEGDATVDLVRQAGGEAIFVKADTSSAADVETAVARTIEAFGRLDYGVNNAGTEGEARVLAEHDEASWNQVLDTNLKGMWLCPKYDLARMLAPAGSGGAIVNVTSVYGFVGGPTRGPYSSSKHGIIGLTKSAALENARKGVRINAVAPGYVITAMAERTTPDPEAKRKLEEAHPIGRGASAEEIAECIAWLCSDRSSYVLGHTLVADGGYIIQ